MRCKHPFLLLITLILLSASGCMRMTTQAPSGTSLPEATPLAPATTEAIQGYLQFPYLSADAGNFNLQAGEQITITWIDAPRDATSYELSLLDQNGTPIQTYAMGKTEAGSVEKNWQVPPELSGKLEGRAYFNGGQVVRSGCCSNIYSNRLPPEGICSLRIAGMMPEQLYTQREGESERIIGITPGLYLEVLARSSEGWYRVRTLPGSSTIGGPTEPGIKGWIHVAGDASLFGPCAQIPVENVPEELLQDGQADQEPSG